MAKKKLDIIPYNPRLVERARYLRKHGTLAEKLLWKHLRGKQIHGYILIAKSLQIIISLISTVKS